MWKVIQYIDPEFRQIEKVLSIHHDKDDAIEASMAYSEEHKSNIPIYVRVVEEQLTELEELELQYQETDDYESRQSILQQAKEYEAYLYETYGETT